MSVQTLKIEYKELRATYVDDAYTVIDNDYNEDVEAAINVLFEDQEPIMIDIITDTPVISVTPSIGILN